MQPHARANQIPFASGTNAHPYGRWSYRDRGCHTTYNDRFKGMQNRPHKSNTEMNNQGYRSIKMTFPQATFASCRYATGLKANRPLQYSNWHSRDHEWDSPAGKVRLSRSAPLDPSKLGDPSVHHPAVHKPASPPASTGIRQPGVNQPQQRGHTHSETMLLEKEIYRPSKRRLPRETPKVWDYRVRGWVAQAEADSLTTHTGY